MTPPKPRLGDGTKVVPKNIAEVRTGAGDVLYQYNALPDSGVARYRHEQNLQDSWYNNDATDNSSAGYSTTAEEGSYSKEFDGEGDYYTSPITPQPQESESAFAWVYRTASKTQRVLTAADSGDADAYYIKVESDNTVTVRQHDGDTATSVTASTALSSSTWYHIGFTHDAAANTLEVYVNGSSEGEATTSTSGGRTTVDVDVGRWPFGPGEYWDGLIDDLRFYNKALSSTEVSNLYNTGSI